MGDMPAAVATAIANERRGLGALTRWAVPTCVLFGAAAMTFGAVWCWGPVVFVVLLVLSSWRLLRAASRATWERREDAEVHIAGPSLRTGTVITIGSEPERLLTRGFRPVVIHQYAGPVHVGRVGSSTLVVVPVLPRVCRVARDPAPWLRPR